MTTRYLPAPAPYTGADPCGGCGGRKVTGARFRFDPVADPSDPGMVLLVDQLCPACGGCGRFSHTGCEPREHAEWDLDLDDQDDERGCPSCRGPGWFTVQAFPDGTDYVYFLRVPCSCAMDQLVEAE